jgi:hypothetical protein
LRRRGYQPLAGRAIVTKERKAALAVRAIFGELTQLRTGEGRPSRVRA